MKIRDLEIVFENANKILSKIKTEHQNLKAIPVISIGYGQIKEGMSPESIIHEAASTLVPSRLRQECIYLSILLRESRRYYSELDSPEIKIISNHIHKTLLSKSEMIEVSEESQVLLLLDDLDYDLIAELKENPLLKAFSSSKSSIRLSIGKIKDLKIIGKEE